MNGPEELEGKIARLHTSTRPSTDMRILDDAFAALDAAVGSGSRASRSKQPSIIRLGLRRVAAVAAVLAIAFALLLTLRSHDIQFQDVSDCLIQAQNIHITDYDSASDGKPTRDIWISKPLKLKLYETHEGFHQAYVLWDAMHNIRSFRLAASDLVARHSLPPEATASVEESMKGAMGLVPFADANSRPSSLEWTPVPTSQLAAAPEDSRVFDLTWTDSELAHKCRIFYDLKTKFPKRIERYVANAGKTDYTLKVAQLISLSSESDIQTKVYDVFGPFDPTMEVPPSPPGFISTPSDY